jgi:hypothetical protein
MGRAALDREWNFRRELREGSRTLSRIRAWGRAAPVAEMAKSVLKAARESPVHVDERADDDLPVTRSTSTSLSF